VARGLVNPPDGKGTSATYSYRHLLQILAIKLRQMEGATLDRLVEEFRDLPGDVLEHRVATALGRSLPAPEALVAVPSRPGVATRVSAPQAGSLPGRGVRRIAVEAGVEVLIDDSHPAWRDPALFGTLSSRVADVLATLRAPVATDD
jgi:hypothetical protein